MTYKVKIVFYDYNSDRVVEPSGCHVIINGTQYSSGQEVTLSADSLSLEYQLSGSSGYDTFQQWRYSTNGGYTFTSKSNQTVLVTPTDQCYVIIQCQIKGAKYTINYSYDYPDGSQGSASEQYTYGASYSIKSKISCTGYIFKGWRINGTVHAPGETFYGKIGGETANGVWEAGQERQFTVYYNYNDSSGNVTSDSNAVGNSYFALRQAPTYNGYSFLGWEIDGVLYGAKSAYPMPSRDVVAEGRWGPGKITLSFNMNGGVPGIAPITVERGVEFELPKTVPTKTGDNVFYGWNFNSSYYGAGEKVTLNTTSTSYSPTAQYSNQTGQQTVNYNVNSTYGEITGVPSSPSYDSWNATSAKVKRDRHGTYGAPPFVSAKEGYIFAGWFEGSNNLTSRPISATTKICNYSGSVYVYAVFYCKLALRFYPNSGFWTDGTTSSYKEIQFKRGDRYSGFPSVARSGYSGCLGWFTSSGIAGGIEYKQGDVCAFESSSTSTINVNARWPQLLTLDTNGGSESFDKMEFPYLAKYENLPVATRDGYNFTGWWTSTSNGTKIDGNSRASSATTRTIYAQWSEIKYTVIFNPNGGTVSPSSAVGGRSTYVYLPSPSRSGYSFEGWYTAPDGGTRVGGSGTYYYPQSDITIYAHWTEIRYTITFNANGGTVSPGSAEGSSITPITLPLPEYEGYEFKGWFTSSSGGTLIGNAGDEYRPTSNRTIYAHWESLVSEVTITFYANGGEFDGGETIVQRTIKANQYLYIPSATKQGAKIKFYSETSSGGGEILESTYSIYIDLKKLVYFNSHDKFYAQWYTGEKITFYPNGGRFADGSEDSQKVIYFNTGESYSNFPGVEHSEYSICGGWWTYSSVYGGVHYKDDGSQTCQTTNNVSLYARWPQIVTYNANGGTCDVEKGEFLVNSDDGGENYYIGLPDSSKVRKEGEEFKGWYDTKYGGSKVDESTVVSNDQTRTLYAHFSSTPESATIILDADGGMFEDGSDRMEIELHLGQTFYSPNVTKDHCRVEGERYYNSDYAYFSVGANISFNASFFEAVIENPVFKPTWIPVWYYTFLAYDGTVIPYSGIKVYDQGKDKFYKSNAPSIPVRRGYEPVGWTPDLPADETPVTGDRTFTATYTQSDFYVTFVDWNGRTLQSKQYKRGDAVIPPSTQTRPGYTFVGWEPANFSPATEPMTVRAKYRGQPVTISFDPAGGKWSDGTTGIKVTTQYKGDKVVEPDRPTREKEDPDMMPRGDDPPSEKKKYVFTGWAPSLGVVDQPMTYTAAWTSSWIPPVTPGTSSFGQKASDYIFVTPPSDYINNSPKGDPMPIRMGRSDRDGKLLRWEDPIYLSEWAAEFCYFVNKSNYPPTPEAISNDRSVNASRLVSGITKENGEEVGDYYYGYSYGSVAAKLLAGNYFARYLEYSRYRWYDQDYVLCKIGSFSPMTQPEKIESVNVDNASGLSVYGSGVGEGDLGGSDRISVKRNCMIDTVTTGSTAGAYIKSYLLDDEEEPKQRGCGISQNIPLTLYYMAQEMSKAFILTRTFDLVTKKGEKQEWSETIERNLVTRDEHGEYIDPEIENSYYTENWSSEERYDPEHAPSGGVEYHSSKTRKATHDPSNEDDGSGKPTVTKTELNETKPSRGSLGTTIMSVEIYEHGDVDWSDTRGATSSSDPEPYWDTYYGWPQWVLTWTNHYQYFTYLSDGPNYRVNGSITKYSELTFTIGVSSILRSHTSDGSPNGNGTFIEPLKFFMLVQISIAECSVKKTYSTAWNHYYPQVSDNDVDEQPLEQKSHYVVVPFDAEYVGQTGTDISPNYSCIYKVSDLDKIIDSAVETAGIKEEWDAYMKEPPTRKGGDRQPTMKWVAEDGKYYDYDSEKQTGCSGGCTTSFTGRASISIMQIGAALKYTPWPSIGLPEVAPS